MHPIRKCLAKRILTKQHQFFFLRRRFFLKFCFILLIIRFRQFRDIKITHRITMLHRHIFKPRITSFQQQHAIQREIIVFGEEFRRRRHHHTALCRRQFVHFSLHGTQIMMMMIVIHTHCDCCIPLLILLLLLSLVLLSFLLQHVIVRFMRRRVLEKLVARVKLCALRIGNHHQHRRDIFALIPVLVTDIFRQRLVQERAGFLAFQRRQCILNLTERCAPFTQTFRGPQHIAIDRLHEFTQLLTRIKMALVPQEIRNVATNGLIVDRQ
mmetsp:Transcript_25663/g.41909  ORF Transcript_25663/g.41909 Transcript_25663/m.41909 type:complete len:268 (+) Transcript_25663:508-1311(+)